MELVVELVARTAGAVAERIAALDHEAVDDAVERQPVVERLGPFWPVFGSFHAFVPSARPTKLATVFGRLVVEQLDDEGALVGGDVRVGAWLSGHRIPSLCASGVCVKRGRGGTSSYNCPS